MADLEYWPQNLVPFLAFMRRVFRIFHLVTELEQGVFDIVEAIWWRLAISC